MMTLQISILRGATLAANNIRDYFFGYILYVGRVVKTLDMILILAMSHATLWKCLQPRQRDR